MSILSERPRLADPLDDPPPPSPLGAPAAAAVRAAAAGVVPLAVPVVLAWILGVGGRATWTQAARLCLGLWLLAHHTGLTISGGHVGLVPLGMAAIPLTSTWFAGRRLARVMDPSADRIAAGRTRAVPRPLPARSLIVFCAVYGLLAALASVAAGMPGMRPVSAQAVVGAGVVAAVGGGLGASAYRRGGLRAALREVLRRAPAPLRPCLRPAAAALATQAAAGAACVAVLLATHVGGVTALDRALRPGAVGEIVLTLGEIFLLPNLVLWACAVLAGPGIALGSGTSVTLVASRLGPLPAVPILAATPAPGRMPTMALALAVVPVLSGVVAGVVVARRAEAVRTRLRQAAITAGLAGVGAGLSAWLSAGPAGPGRLSAVGPTPLWVAGAVGVEVLLGAGLAVAVAAGAGAVREGPSIRPRVVRPARLVERINRSRASGAAPTQASTEPTPPLTRIRTAARTVWRTGTDRSGQVWDRVRHRGVRSDGATAPDDVRTPPHTADDRRT